jgi:hypothetical protein
MKPRYKAHANGKQPADSYSLVEVVFKDGFTYSGLPVWAWRWSKNHVDSDIIAYRVIEQE